MTTVLRFEASVLVLSHKTRNPWASVGIRAILCCKKQGIRGCGGLLVHIVTCRNPWASVA